MRALFLTLLVAGCGLNPISKAPVTGDSGFTDDDFMMIGDVRVSPAEVAFGQALLDADTTIEVKLTNLGDSDAELSSAYLEGDTAFTLTTATPEVMSSGASASVVVTFSPDAEQDFSGTLNLLIAGEADIAVLDISGTGSLTVDTDTDTDTGDTNNTGAGKLSLETTRIEIGKAPTNSTTARTVEVTNTGGEDVLISDVVSDNPALAGDLGVPVVLSPGESEDLLISLVPTTVGSFSGTLTIENDSGTDPTITVVATAYEACEICDPILSVITGGSDAYTMDQFKATSINNPDEQSLTLTNIGDVDMEISDITIVNDSDAASKLICGRDGSYSLGAMTLPATIPPNSSISVPVRYRYSGSSAFCGEFSLDASVNVLTILSDATTPSYGISLGGGYSVF